MHLTIPQNTVSIIARPLPLAVAGIVFGLANAACTPTVNLNTRGYDKTHFYFVDRPEQRQRDPDTYFRHEYRYLNARKGVDSDARPSRLLGLAFSGGGIRSAAFQLGMLSGLNTGAAGRRLLPEFDYISSVSGGSWANGSYWSARQSDAELFSCLDGYADSGVPKIGCAPPRNRLRNTQKISILPHDGEELKKRKAIWEQDIIAAHLGDCNIDFDAAPRKGYDAAATAPCRTAAARRPYPIFNSTHSSSSESANAGHYPFQSTPDYQGTIVDQAKYRGFFLKSGTPEFAWENRDWLRYIPGGQGDDPGEVLSLMLAHSSGVIGTETPILLEYNFHARYRGAQGHGARISGLRKVYQLADGGKSDNLGLIPLLERGVDTIVVSQMGKEGQDFKDLNLAAQQADRLFGCTFKGHWNRADTPIVTTTPWTCPTGAGGQGHGLLILVRPTVQNVSAFLDDLRRHHAELYTALQQLDRNEKPKDRFPETPTFREKYQPELIRAYYLLGRYLGSTAVREAVIGKRQLGHKQPG